MDFSGERLVIGASQQCDEVEHVARYRFAASYVAERVVVDIACGTGYGTAMLAAGSPVSVVGVDISPDAVAHALAHYAGEYVVGDVTTFGDDEAYDLVVSFETIEHVEDAAAALANLHRILRPSGQLIVSSPFRPLTSPWARSAASTPRNKFHVREFVPSELESLLVHAGFVVDGPVYGQRLQPHLPRWLAPMFTKVTRTYALLDPAVMPLGGRDPRIFVMVASKPAR
ncbi:MAG: class I SAM-dependent methyltransferase [Acidimicrobiales bacterium]